MAKEEQLLEEAGVKVPHFNEQDFIRKELISFKTTFVLFLFSVFVAGATYLVWKTTQLRFLVLLLVAVALGVALLRPLFRVSRIDISHWKRKEWVGTILLYAFFWLGFTLLFVNPPLADASAPRIQIEVTPAVQAVNQTVALSTYVADNVALRGEPVFCILRAAPGGPQNVSALTPEQRVACGGDWTRVPDRPLWTAKFTPDREGTYLVLVQATDKAGHGNETYHSFAAGNPFLIVDPPGRDDASEFVDTTNYFSVQPRPELSRDGRLLSIQYRIDGEDWHHFVPDKNRPGFWITDPTYPGWKNGPNTVEVRAVEHPRFLYDGTPSGHRLEGGVVQDPRSWKVTVDPNFPATLGTSAEPSPTPARYVAPGSTPSPGLAAILLVLAGALLLGRRTKDV